uniref:Uncharacterized protein n=1 Tax=Oryza nivara TaxID=4536 RepID=A0A0E0H088_ORYNI
MPVRPRPDWVFTCRPPPVDLPHMYHCSTAIQNLRRSMGTTAPAPPAGQSLRAATGRASPGHWPLLPPHRPLPPRRAASSHRTGTSTAPPRTTVASAATDRASLASALASRTSCTRCLRRRRRPAGQPADAPLPASAVSAGSFPRLHLSACASAFAQLRHRLRTAKPCRLCLRTAAPQPRPRRLCTAALRRLAAWGSGLGLLLWIRIEGGRIWPPRRPRARRRRLGVALAPDPRSRLRIRQGRLAMSFALAVAQRRCRRPEDRSGLRANAATSGEKAPPPPSLRPRHGFRRPAQAAARQKEGSEGWCCGGG